MAPRAPRSHLEASATRRRYARLQRRASSFRILMGHMNADLAWEAVEEGAHDFLPKEEITPPLLEWTLRYAVRRGRAEAEPWEQKERFKTLLDLSVLSICMIDRKGRFTYVNQRLADLLEREPGDLVGRRSPTSPPPRRTSPGPPFDLHYLLPP